MTLTAIQSAFSAGEISPSLFGRTDLAKYHQGTSTMRNIFVNYRGGGSSRAGQAYVGMCKQGAPNIGGTSTTNPPRDIPFQFNINQGYALEFGDQYMRIKSNGAYVTESAVTVSSVSTAALFTTSTAHGYAVGDWIFDQGNAGFSGLIWIVKTTPSGTTFTVTDLFGIVISAATASTAGTVARIYTAVAPYAAVDLPFLKFTQSADTMSLTCVNQVTFTEYPSYELVRNGITNWTFTQVSFASIISPPSSVSITAQSSTTVSTWYSYVVTAVDAATGEESVASTVVNIENNDISINAGSNTITWSPVSGAGSYNVYKATPSYNVQVPVGSLYGFMGTAFGTQITDTNITADFTNVPPVHNDPFARGTISSITITAGGSAYTQVTIGYTITTSTGSGFIGTPIVVGGALVGFIISNAGTGYKAGDTIAITGSVGSGATATLVIGAQTGTYPGTVAYFQQRRFYGYTLDEPDTYFASQPGAYKNMDSSIPTTDSDAFIGTPWAQQVNGIQFMVPMTGNLVILTGNGAWSLNGGNNAAITPADQTATAQAYNGCNDHIPPIVVNYDILYVQSKGSIVRDLSYNFFVNIYTGTDTTVLSSHLFNFHQLQQWAYAEEPYKLIWAVRDDGVMLSLTYLKEQDVYAWARHDTNGLFVGVCSITEPPVNAVYTIVKRYIRGHNTWVYYAERMDNRNWENVEDCFCVDAGLSYPMSFPNATLMPAAANGTNNISSTEIILGGSGYTAPVITAADPTGAGTGATFSTTLVSGVITAITPTAQGSNYAQGSTLEITDATGNGAIAQPIITNNVIFTTSASVFNSGMVGNVIRIGNNNASSAANFNITASGGGKAIITTYTSATQVTANIIEPITNVLLNDPNFTPIPVSPNQWSISVPVTSVSGLNHLEGMTVATLADGSVVPNQIVTNGKITLPAPASAITIGLPYVCQLQTLYLDPPSSETTQGKRKNIYAVTVRLEASRGMQVGANQPDQSTQPNNATVPWTNMQEIKERTPLISAGTAIPLFSGDERLLITSDDDEKGQIAIQQIYPLPLNILACIPEYSLGDTGGA